MHISNTLAASFFLGLPTCLSGTALGMMGDDPRVRVVELPNEGMNYFPQLAFSDDGSTIIVLDSRFSNQQAWVYRDESWELALDYAAMNREAIPYISGVSGDGSVFVVTDYISSIVSRDGVIREVPHVWIDDAGEVVQDGRVYVRSVSRDGQTLGLRGYLEGVGGNDALIWNNAHGLINLNIGSTGDEVGHSIGAMNPDASVIAGSSTVEAPMNDVRGVRALRESWVLSGKGLAYIPPLDLGYDVTMIVQDVSDDGRAVIGISHSFWRNPHPITSVYDSPRVYGPTQSWIWRPGFGTQLIIDAAGVHSEIHARNISDDGQVVFGLVQSGQFLWTREGGFLLLDEYLESRGIEIDFHFRAASMSDDGTLLMGRGYDLNAGQHFLVIVDISE